MEGSTTKTFQQQNTTNTSEFTTHHTFELHRERFDDMIDHPGHTRNLSSCEIKA